MAQKNKVPAKSQVKKVPVEQTKSKAAPVSAATVAKSTATKSEVNANSRQKSAKNAAASAGNSVPKTSSKPTATVAGKVKAKVPTSPAAKAADDAKAAASVKAKQPSSATKAPLRTKPAAPVAAGVVVAKAAAAESASSAGARAVPTAVAKAAVKTSPSPSPQTPRDIAAKAAEARQQQASADAKKPVNQRHGFKTNEYIVYPAHGVGRIVGIEEQEIAGMSLELFVIQFEKDKMTLRVPTGKLQSVGMRKLADDDIVTKAMTTLKGRARIKRTMWSRRAQEYEAKINSGDLVSIAEVVRDLYRSESQPEQSYSERQLYEAALDRMAREIAAVEQLDERGAVQRITEVLAKSARGRRIAMESAEEANGGEQVDVKAA